MSTVMITSQLERMKRKTLTYSQGYFIRGQYIEMS